MAKHKLPDGTWSDEPEGTGKDSPDGEAILTPVDGKAPSPLSTAPTVLDFEPSAEFLRRIRGEKAPQEPASSPEEAVLTPVEEPAARPAAAAKPVPAASGAPAEEAVLTPVEEPAARLAAAATPVPAASGAPAGEAVLTPVEEPPATKPEAAVLTPVRDDPPAEATLTPLTSEPPREALLTPAAEPPAARPSKAAPAPAPAPAPAKTAPPKPKAPSFKHGPPPAPAPRLINDLVHDKLPLLLLLVQEKSLADFCRDREPVELIRSRLTHFTSLFRRMTERPGDDQIAANRLMQDERWRLIMRLEQAASDETFREVIDNLAREAMDWLRRKLLDEALPLVDDDHYLDMGEQLVMSKKAEQLGLGPADLREVHRILVSRGVELEKAEPLYQRTDVTKLPLIVDALDLPDMASRNLERVLADLRAAAKQRSLITWIMSQGYNKRSPLYLAAREAESLAAGADIPAIAACRLVLWSAGVEALGTEKRSPRNLEELLAAVRDQGVEPVLGAALRTRQLSQWLRASLRTSDTAPLLGPGDPLVKEAIDAERASENHGPRSRQEYRAAWEFLWAAGEPALSLDLAGLRPKLTVREPHELAAIVEGQGILALLRPLVDDTLGTWLTLRGDARGAELAQAAAEAAPPGEITEARWRTDAVARMLWALAFHLGVDWLPGEKDPWAAVPANQRVNNAEEIVLRLRSGSRAQVRLWLELEALSHWPGASALPETIRAVIDEEERRFAASPDGVSAELGLSRVQWVAGDQRLLLGDGSSITDIPSFLARDAAMPPLVRAATDGLLGAWLRHVTGNDMQGEVDRRLRAFGGASQRPDLMVWCFRWMLGNPLLKRAEFELASPSREIILNECKRKRDGSRRLGELLASGHISAWLETLTAYADLLSPEHQRSLEDLNDALSAKNDRTSGLDSLVGSTLHVTSNASGKDAPKLLDAQKTLVLESDSVELIAEEAAELMRYGLRERVMVLLNSVQTLVPGHDQLRQLWEAVKPAAGTAKGQPSPNSGGINLMLMTVPPEVAHWRGTQFRLMLGDAALRLENPRGGEDVLTAEDTHRLMLKVHTRWREVSRPAILIQLEAWLAFRNGTPLALTPGPPAPSGTLWGVLAEYGDTFLRGSNGAPLTGRDGQIIGGEGKCPAAGRLRALQEILNADDAIPTPIEEAVADGSLTRWLELHDHAAWTQLQDRIERLTRKGEADGFRRQVVLWALGWRKLEVAPGLDVTTGRELVELAGERRAEIERLLDSGLLACWMPEASELEEEMAGIAERLPDLPAASRTEDAAEYHQRLRWLNRAAEVVELAGGTPDQWQVDLAKLPRPVVPPHEDAVVAIPLKLKARGDIRLFAGATEAGRPACEPGPLDPELDTFLPVRCRLRREKEPWKREYDVAFGKATGRSVIPVVIHTREGVNPEEYMRGVQIAFLGGIAGCGLGVLLGVAWYWVLNIPLTRFSLPNAWRMAVLGAAPGDRLAQLFAERLVTDLGFFGLGLVLITGVIAGIRTQKQRKIELVLAWIVFAVLTLIVFLALAWVGAMAFFSNAWVSQVFSTVRLAARYSALSGGGVAFVDQPVWSASIAIGIWTGGITGLAAGFAIGRQRIEAAVTFLLGSVGLVLWLT